MPKGHNEADVYASSEELERIYKNHTVLRATDSRDELAHRHMIALADHFEGWALDAQVAPEDTARLIGMADALRQLADLVGPDWNPPEPERLSIMGFIARKVLEEI